MHSIQDKALFRTFATLLKHHTKAWNRLYDWNWSTYTAVKNLGKNSKTVVCLTLVSSWKINIGICGRRQLFVRKYLHKWTGLSLTQINWSKKRNRPTDENLTSVVRHNKNHIDLKGALDICGAGTTISLAICYVLITHKHINLYRDQFLFVTIYIG
jgi:hypothetical protein